MVKDYFYKVVRFNSKEVNWFNDLLLDGVVVEDFDTFVKQAFYNRVNDLRSVRLAKLDKKVKKAEL